MCSYKDFHRNAEDGNTFAKATMTSWDFLQYWLHAAFPHCYGLHRYLLRHFPYSKEWMAQEIIPIHRTVVIEQQVVTILLYRYHVEYRVEGQEVFQPYFPYHAVKFLDSDTFFLLLPIVDMSECGYSYFKLMPDLIQRFSETALPAESIEDVAYALSVGLAEADGAEDEPLWTIWQETEDSLYGAEWWADAGELHLFQQRNLEEGRLPSVYISAPVEEDIFLWGKRMLSQWISSLPKS